MIILAISVGKFLTNFSKHSVKQRKESLICRKSVKFAERNKIMFRLVITNDVRIYAEKDIPSDGLNHLRDHEDD